MITSPFNDDLSVRIWRSITAAIRIARARNRPNYSHLNNSWVYRCSALERTLRDKLHIQQPITSTHSYLASGVACKFGRSVAAAIWREGAIKKLSTPIETQSENDLNAQRPSDVRPSAYSAYINDYYITSPEGTALTTPLHIRGPGGAGGILALTTNPLPRQQLALISRLRLGRLGLHMSPANQKQTYTPPSSTSTWFHDYSTNEPCCRCNHPFEDPFHVLVECTYEPVLTARSRILDTMRPFLYNLISTLLFIQQNTPWPHQRHMPRDYLSLHYNHIHNRLTDNGRAESEMWNCPIGKATLFRLLLVLPWSERTIRQAKGRCLNVPDPPPARHARVQPAAVVSIPTLMATLFRSTTVKPHRIRTFANTWAKWAGKACETIIKAWAPNPPPVHGNPPPRSRGRRHSALDFLPESDSDTD